MTELKLKVQTGFFKRVAAIAMAVCLSVGMLPEAVSAENAAGKGTVESISITPNGPVELTEKGQTVTLTANVTYKNVKMMLPLPRLLRQHRRRHPPRQRRPLRRRRLHR